MPGDWGKALASTKRQLIAAPMIPSGHPRLSEWSTFRSGYIPASDSTSTPAKGWIEELFGLLTAGINLPENPRTEDRTGRVRRLS